MTWIARMRTRYLPNWFRGENPAEKERDFQIPGHRTEEGMVLVPWDSVPAANNEVEIDELEGRIGADEQNSHMPLRLLGKAA